MRAMTLCEGSRERRMRSKAMELLVSHMPMRKKMSLTYKSRCQASMASGVRSATISPKPLAMARKTKTPWMRATTILRKAA